MAQKVKVQCWGPVWSEKVGGVVGGWISSRSGWLLELLTELTKKSSTAMCWGPCDLIRPCPDNCSKLVKKSEKCFAKRSRHCRRNCSTLGKMSVRVVLSRAIKALVSWNLWNRTAGNWMLIFNWRLPATPKWFWFLPWNWENQDIVMLFQHDCARLIKS